MPIKFTAVWYVAVQFWLGPTLPYEPYYYCILQLVRVTEFNVTFKRLKA